MTSKNETVELTTEQIELFRSIESAVHEHLEDLERFNKRTGRHRKIADIESIFGMFDTYYFELLESLGDILIEPYRNDDGFDEVRRRLEEDANVY